MTRKETCSQLHQCWRVVSRGSYRQRGSTKVVQRDLSAWHLSAIAMPGLRWNPIFWDIWWDMSTETTRFVRERLGAPHWSVVRDVRGGQTCALDCPSKVHHDTNVKSGLRIDFKGKKSGNAFNGAYVKAAVWELNAC